MINTTGYSATERGRGAQRITNRSKSSTLRRPFRFSRYPTVSSGNFSGFSYSAGNLSISSFPSIIFLSMHLGNFLVTMEFYGHMERSYLTIMHDHVNVMLSQTDARRAQPANKKEQGLPYNGKMEGRGDRQRKGAQGGGEKREKMECH